MKLQGLADRPTVPSYRILVVDDQQDVADSFAALLEVMGHQVEVAYSGPTALVLARRQRPRIAFLDVSMPGRAARSSHRVCARNSHGRSSCWWR